MPHHCLTQGFHHYSQVLQELDAGLIVRLFPLQFHYQVSFFLLVDIGFEYIDDQVGVLDQLVYYRLLGLHRGKIQYHSVFHNHLPPAPGHGKYPIRLAIRK